MTQLEYKINHLEENLIDVDCREKDHKEFIKNIKLILKKASLFSKDFLNEKATHELNNIVEIENKRNRDDLIYTMRNKEKDKTYDFQKFTTIRFF